MKKLAIGIVSPYDIFRFGGVQEHALAVRDELTARGHSVHIIAPHTTAAEDNDDDTIITIGAATKVNTPLATTTEVAFSASPGEITELYQDHPFDVMHFHEPWVPVLSRQLLAKSPAKNVGTFHAKLPDTLFNKSIEKAWLPYGRSVVKKLDALTAVSDAAAEYVSQATNRQLHIVPNGITLNDFDPSKVKAYTEFDDNVPTILYIGRLEKRKGVEYLLRAYRELLDRQPEVRLVIAGDGPKRRTLKSYCTRHSLEQVHFLGFVSNEDKLRLLKAADLFCSPAIYGESFGIVLLEAMAMDTPIVAGNNPGYSSVLKQRGRISLVDPRDTAGFSRQLELVLFDKELSKLLRNWGKQYVTQFDYANIVDKYEDIYQSVLK